MEKNEKQLVSVIIPIYNVEKYINKCLESVRRQTYKNIEVIMVNDGSTDSSGKIAEDFSHKDSRFLYFEKQNNGLSSARNFGLNSAVGKYVFFLDSDDWLLENCIENYVKEFDDTIDIVIGKYMLEDNILGKSYVPYEAEKINEVFKQEKKEREILERHLNAYPGHGFLIRDTLMPVWKNMYKRNLLTIYNIVFVSERKIGSEDYAFNFEAYYYSSAIKLAPIVGCVHVIVPGSLSRRYYAEALERTLFRKEYIKASMGGKDFYNRDNIIKALNNENCRMIIGILNNICKSKNIDRLEQIKKVMSNPEVSNVLNTDMKPNLSRDYLIIFWALRHLGIKMTYGLLRFVNANYNLYRMFQYICRKK